MCDVRVFSRKLPSWEARVLPVSVGQPFPVCCLHLESHWVWWCSAQEDWRVSSSFIQWALPALGAISWKVLVGGLWLRQSLWSRSLQSVHCGGGRDKCAHRKSREKCCASRKSMSLTVSLGGSRSRMSQVLNGGWCGKHTERWGRFSRWAMRGGFLPALPGGRLAERR